MADLAFHDHMSLEEVFENYKMEIYDNILINIQKNLNSSQNDEVAILTICILTCEYTIHTSPENFAKVVQLAIKFYESAEEFEKCNVCQSLISQLLD